MCIIVYKPCGAEFPPISVLSTCFDNNSDGAGFAYPSGRTTFNGDKVRISTFGKVTIRKGLMTWKEFEEAYTSTFFDEKAQRWRTELPVIFHFRIRTHGKSDAGATQPIAVTQKVNTLRATMCESSVAVAHNGIISKCCDAKSKLSDSQIFARDYLTVLKLYQDITAHKCNMIKDIIGAGNKMALMNGSGEVAIIGDFQEWQGCYYSNSSYKETYVSSKYVTDFLGYDYYANRMKQTRTNHKSKDLECWGVYNFDGGLYY